MTSRFLQALFALLFAAMVTSQAAVGAEQTIHKNLDAEILGEQLLLLRSDKRIQVWDLRSGNVDYEKSHQLSSRSMQFIAVWNDHLWGADESTVYWWDRREPGWSPKYDLSWFKKEPIDLVVVEGEPFVIYEEFLMRPSDLEIFVVPFIQNDAEDYPVSRLRPLVIKVYGSKIWIGNSFGEWGGNLTAFDTRTEKWLFHIDKLHYVTDITEISLEEMAVSWSMNHFSTLSRLRIHSNDTSVVREFEELASKQGKFGRVGGYLQKIVYDQESGQIFAMERNKFVLLEKGQPKKITESGPPLRNSKGRRISLNGNVIAMLSTKSAGILVVMKFAEPYVFKDGVFRQLRQ